MMRWMILLLPCLGSLFGTMSLVQMRWQLAMSA
jgi:hypothetical protein